MAASAQQVLDEMAEMRRQLNQLAGALQTSQQQTAALEAQMAAGVPMGPQGAPPWQALVDALATRGRDISDSRGFQKLTKFDPQSKDEWKDWAPVLLSYVGTVDVNLKDAMHAQRGEETPQWNAIQEEETVALSAKLHYMLTQLTVGVALDIVVSALSSRNACHATAAETAE